MPQTIRYITSTDKSSISSGFFNSAEGTRDRVYDAEQISSIFDGIVMDGIYETYGDAFMVEPADNGMWIKVGTGRAWFNHVWFLNDAIITIKIDDSNIGAQRIDALVIEINKEANIREGRFAVVRGPGCGPTEEPVKPELINDDYVHQYPIAYIKVREQASEITAADIEYMVNNGTPFVTGILEHEDLTVAINRWNTIVEEKTKKMEKDFKDWWDTVAVVLDADVAGNIENQINYILNILESFGNAEESRY